MRSSLPSKLHVNIIMDGYGRWATRMRLPRQTGHRAGEEVVRRVVDASPELGVAKLTLYAFSTKNRRRPETESGGHSRSDEFQIATVDQREATPSKTGHALTRTTPRSQAS